MSSVNATSSTTSSSLLRVTGMASGIDTDSVVKSMVSSYQTKIDKASQAKQTLQWKQEAYRDIIKDIKGLQEYFDPLSDKYLLSEKSLNTNATASDDTSVVSATASSSAKAGNYKVEVTQLATQAKIQGSSQNSMIKVSNLSNWDSKTLTFGSVKIKLSDIDGSTQLNATSMSNLAADINKQLASTSLNGKVSASYVNDGTTNYIKFVSSDSNTTLTKSGTDIGEDSFTSDLKINSGISSSSKLVSNLGFSTGTINFTLTNGTTKYPVTLTVSDTSTVQNLMDAVNSATSGAVTMSVDDATGEISFQSKSYGSASNIGITDTSTSNNVLTKFGIENAKIEGTKTGISSESKLVSKDLGFSQGTIKFTLTNGTTDYTVSLDVDNDTTMQDLIDAVKEKTSGSITMSVDNATGKISFSGYTSNISIKDSNTENNIITNLGISSTANNTSNVGKDALVSITAPGQSEVTTTQSSNNFTLNGIAYNLVGTNPGETVNVTVTSDSDNVVSNIKKFITDYNSVIDTINTKLTEKKDSDYPPLTDSQKEDMSDDQITAWEAKAKVGILRNDDYLSSLMIQLRGIFSSPVYSSYNSSDTTTGKISLSFGQYGTNAIGIDTTTDYTDGGKLVLEDETKLKDAIENNFDDFKKLFIGTSTSSLGTNATYVGSKKYNEDGIFKRMDTILRDYVAAPGVGDDGTYTLSGSMNIFVNKQYDYSSTGSSSKNTLPDQVYIQTLSISKLNDQMSDAETRYYAKFTALETAMSTLNAQQSTLSSMLGTS